MGKTFDPYDAMLTAYTKANCDRLRITHWRVNRAAVYSIAAHPFTAQMYSPKPIIERDFMGIPLCLVADDDSDVPAFEPVFETCGRRGDLIHDYEGPIRHGLDQQRFMNMLSDEMDEREKMGLDRWPRSHASD